jgi:hypothetical protein
MTSIGDIFDLPDGTEGTYHDEEPKQEKKPRKKAEMSDEKKAAMLERLKAGREKRAENLKAKAQPKQPEEPKKEKEVVSKKEKEVVKKTNEDDNQRLKLSFIKMMAGKEKNGEKYERPKKKIVSTNSQSEYKEENSQREYKEEATKNKVNEAPAPVVAPILSAPITIIKEPVVIRTFKKPIWA